MCWLTNSGLIRIIYCFAFYKKFENKALTLIMSLVTFVVCNNVVNHMVKAFKRIFIFWAAVDQLLLAERASLAGTRALVSAVTNDFSLFAGIDGWCVDQGVVAEEDWTLAFIISRFLQAECEAGVITSFVVSPVFRSQLNSFSNSSRSGNWCSYGRSTSRGSWYGGILSRSKSDKKADNSNKLNHFDLKKIQHVFYDRKSQTGFDSDLLPFSLSSKFIFLFQQKYQYDFVVPFFLKYFFWNTSFNTVTWCLSF